MSVSYNKTYLCVDDLCKGIMNLSTDIIKCALVLTAPTASGTHVYADLAGELGTSNGYTAGGKAGGTDFTWSISNATGTESWNCTAITWTSSTGSMGPFRYIAFYDSTPSTKTVLGWYDYGSNLTLNGANSDTFTITPSGNVLATLA
jgi:hypothetical protein